MIAISKKEHLKATIQKASVYLEYSNQALIELSFDELMQMVAMLPISFQLIEQRWRLVAISSIVENKNIMISPAGKWGGYYCPKSLNKFPLAMGMINKDEEKTFALCVDETSSLWHPEGGEGQLLFDDKGEQSNFLSNQIQYLQRTIKLKEQVNHTLRQALEQGCIKSWVVDDIAWFSEQGLYCVDAEFMMKVNRGEEKIGLWLYQLLLGQMYSMAGMRRLRSANARQNAITKKMSEQQIKQLPNFEIDDSNIGFDNIDFSKL